MKKYISIILLVIITLIFNLPVYAQDEINNIKTKVVKNNGIDEIKNENETTKRVQNLTVRILEGEYENEEYEMVHVISEDIEGIISNIELEEDDNILVDIQEKEGEIISITYKETITQNYVLYVLEFILIVILIIIGIKKGITPIIIYLFTLLLVSLALIFSMKMGWNLILVSSILSFVITVSYIIRANGINTKTLEMILGAVLSVSIAGILMSILFDVMRLNNINIKIAENFVNIKDLICSCMLVVSCGLYNLIILVKLNIDSFFNRPYKTKSDNIIEGQRSLKL